jgi:hypothetical protein
MDRAPLIEAQQTRVTEERSELMSRATALLIAVAALGCGARAEVVFPPEGLSVVDSSTIIARRWSRWRLEPAFTVGGASASDTTLLSPYLLTVAGDLVVEVETDQRIRAFGPNGRLAWQFGAAGGGPGEFRTIRDLKAGAGNNLYVNDPGNGRITVVSPAGRLLRMIRPQGVSHTEWIIPTPDPARVTMIPLGAGPPADVVTIDQSGVAVARDSVPWDGYRQLSDFGRQQVVSADQLGSGRWVQAFYYGNGWFAWDQAGSRSGRRYFIEPTVFPSLIRERLPDGYGEKLIYTEPSARQISLIGDTVFVRFGGKGERAGRQLDLYAWESGNYLASVELPDDIEWAEVAPGWLFTYGTEPAPVIRAYRRLAPAAGDSGRHRAAAGTAESAAGHQRPAAAAAGPHTGEEATAVRAIGGVALRPRPAGGAAHRRLLKRPDPERDHRLHRVGG